MRIAQVIRSEAMSATLHPRNRSLVKPLLATAVVLSLLTACVAGPQPAATPATVTGGALVALATGTPDAVAVAPIPTETAVTISTNTPKLTETPAPTATNTPKPTATPVPTATSTPAPTDTPRPTATARLTLEQLYGEPRFHWISPSDDKVVGYNGDWRTDGWIDIATIGGTVTSGQDPELGNVVVCKITQDTGDDPARAHPTMGVKPENAARGDIISVKLPVRVNNYVPGPKGWASFLSIFAWTDDVDKDVFWGDLVNLDYLSDSRPVLNAKKNQTDGETYQFSPKGSRLTPGKAHRIEVRINSRKKTAEYYLDGKLQSTVELDPHFKDINIYMIHAGAYGVDLPIGAEVVNGPIEISAYSSAK
jgi:hypothetical protein